MAAKVDFLSHRMTKMKFLCAIISHHLYNSVERLNDLAQV